ncbi:scarecrow-like protein 9 [Panicum miliaceum]|uniref:Scarecrow-like protein 9 n=1 Tax=Panicum miliaceum TaxID=4540 RepID=A0A3L6TR24_PANMI|nr:scarecrow-like protein 9 [Panicum miliaceum]
MLKPKVFIHGIVNGSYSTPFFLTRFKEVMYHYSALFDIIDKTLPRADEARMILERDIYLHVVLNVIACEGSERIRETRELQEVEATKQEGRL